MKKNKNLSSFLLEIFTEEIPARLVNELGIQLESIFKDNLDSNAINYSIITRYCTPRRLTLIIGGLANQQKDKERFIVGPPRKISINEKGEFLKPGLAFLEKNSLKKNDIKIIEKDGNKFLSANQHIKGIETKDFLVDVTTNSIKLLKNRKSMRWGSSNIEFVRPIKNIFSLFGKEFIKLKINGIKNENIIYGHRFYSNQGTKINSIKQYLEYMKKSHVILDFKERKKIIVNQIKKIEKKSKFFVEIDEELLDHVANLTEYPNVLSGKFDKNFLQIPKEVNISVMKGHQKYFPVFKDSNYSKLDSQFIFIAGSSFINNQVVISGNEKVIRARLADAKFFYEEDKKIGLSNLVKKLSSITFIEGVGTYKDKSDRILKNSKKLLQILDLDEKKLNVDLKSCCRLLKADLSSQMVYEFPELQGLMGKHYYKKYNKNIAQIIEEHHLPRGRSDALPSNNLAKIISISDKIDIIASCFYLGLNPTGSSDPYGLRRNSIGIIRIAENLKKNIDLIEILNFSIAEVEKSGHSKIKEENKNKAIEFFNERIRNYLIEKGFNMNIVNSLVNNEYQIRDMKSILEKAFVLKKYEGKKELMSVIEIFKRLKNITKENSKIDINENLLDNKFEISLFEELKKLQKAFSPSSMSKNPEVCLKEILKTSPCLSEFFDNVLVMDKNEETKRNRINLLTNMKNIISGFANFSEI